MQHHNSGATIWLSCKKSEMPAGQGTKVTAREPAGIPVYMASGSDPMTALKALADKDGAVFKPEHVETWHVRTVSDQCMVGNAPWDRHPAYTGPEDTTVQVFCPWSSQRRAAQERVSSAAVVVQLEAAPVAPEPAVPQVPETTPASLDPGVTLTPAKPRQRRSVATAPAAAAKPRTRKKT